MNNKFSFLYGYPVINELDKDKQIKEKINNYLNYIDCDSLLRKTDSLIFGGAVRDSIANLEIHDVDIAVLPRAASEISSILKDVGFKLINKSNVDISDLYSNSIISEPITWYKCDTFVQLIRPRIENKTIVSNNILVSLVEQVDISCCGVSFNKTLNEHVSGAYDDCKNHKFRIMEESKLYNQQRVIRRTEKLLSRGWSESKYALQSDMLIYNGIRDEFFNQIRRNPIKNKFSY
jgi:hypothetical protein